MIPSVHLVILRHHLYLSTVHHARSRSAVQVLLWGLMTLSEIYECGALILFLSTLLWGAYSYFSPGRDYFCALSGFPGVLG